jgi:hypothetical protein
MGPPLNLFCIAVKQFHRGKQQTRHPKTMHLSTPLQDCICCLGITGLFIVTVVIVVSISKLDTLSMAHATNTQIIANWILWALDFSRYTLLLRACVGVFRGSQTWAREQNKCSTCMRIFMCAMALLFISVVENVVFPVSSMQSFRFGSYIRSPPIYPVTYFIYSIFFGLILVTVKTINRSRITPTIKKM